MTKIRFQVAYDGTDFCGWQRQAHGPLKSVQHVLEEALEKVFQEKIVLFASGRTDAGVHALRQVCHFETARPLAQMKGWDVAWALNSHLPPSIAVKKAWVAPADFHATLSASHKTYRYLIFNSHRPSPFLHRYTDWLRKPIDVEKLNQCAQLIKGVHDFKSFQSVGSYVPHTVREIYHAEWTWKKSDLLQFEVTGSGFLKQMVRNLVGTMLMIERKRLDSSKMIEILNEQDRKAAGAPAPACGLHLYRVYYPRDLDKRCGSL